MRDAEQEHGKMTPESDSPTSEAKAEPLQPSALLKWVFEQVAVNPWVAGGAMSTVVGIALLYFYFASIDFVPADIPSILSASFLMTLLAIAFYIWILVCLIAPLAMYRAMDMHVEEDESVTPVKSVRTSGLWALQVLGVAWLLLFLGVPRWLRCLPLAECLLTAAAVSTLVGIVGWIRSERKRGTGKGKRAKRWCLALFVSAAGALPFIGLLQVLVFSQSADWPVYLAFLVVWLLVLGASAFLDKLPVVVAALVVTFFSPILFYSLPAFLGVPALFPTKVAQLVGIRAEKVAELRVPISTCKLIESAVGTSKVMKPVNCESGSEWGTVHAQVLSNLGERWLIEVQLDGPQLKGRNGAVRVTIPGEGVHTVRQMPAQSSEQAAGCRT